MSDQKTSHKPNTGEILNESTINTILTSVVRLRQPVTIQTLNNHTYDIQWNPMTTEPEVIEPGTTAINIKGISQVLRWLESTTVVDWKMHLEVDVESDVHSTDILLLIAKQTQQLGAADGHAVIHNMKHTKNITGVVSVYDGIKPAHMVLTELYEWAEKNDPELRDRIIKLDHDMTWNADNPV